MGGGQWGEEKLGNKMGQSFSPLSWNSYYPGLSVAQMKGLILCKWFNHGSSIHMYYLDLHCEELYRKL